MAKKWLDVIQRDEVKRRNREQCAADKAYLKAAEQAKKGGK